MRIQRQDVGNGKYQWFINTESTDISEAKILNWMTNQERDKALGQLNYFGAVDIEIAYAICKNCKFFELIYRDFGLCKNERVYEEIDVDCEDLDEIVFRVDFGCIHFEEKEDAT